jgi:hypothetical protein
MAFESGSRLDRFDGSAFYESGLTSVVIPSSVVVSAKSSFHFSTSLASVAFESDSRLEGID